MDTTTANVDDDRVTKEVVLVLAVLVAAAVTDELVEAGDEVAAPESWSWNLPL